MGVAVRTHREDPWERIRLTRAAMPTTPLQFIGTGFRFISWERAHPEFMELVYDAAGRGNGIDRFVRARPDARHGRRASQRAAQIKRAGGTEIIVALTYTISRRFTTTRSTSGSPRVCGRVAVHRPRLHQGPGRPAHAGAGRGRCCPAVRARARRHSRWSCTRTPRIGLSPLVYLARRRTWACPCCRPAAGALADGTSLPDAQRVVANLRELGHTVDVDDRLLAVAARYFDRLAAAEGLPVGPAAAVRRGVPRHQLAGGVLTTLRRQLAELGLEGRFDAVIEEVSRVRAELGYPIMVTPFPQMVMGQALSNVLGSERYAVVPDQVIRYVLGSFGKPTAPVEPDVLDRILDRPRARELAAEPPPLPVAELRQRLPRGISDEELLLRFGMPADEVDAMLAAAPAARHYTPKAQPVLRLLRELGSRPPVARLVVDKPGFRLSTAGVCGAAVVPWLAGGPGAADGGARVRVRHGRHAGARRPDQ